jgi:virginiamycin B lyase
MINSLSYPQGIPRICLRRLQPRSSPRETFFQCPDFPRITEHAILDKHLGDTESVVSRCMEKNHVSLPHRVVIALAAIVTLALPQAVAAQTVTEFSIPTPGSQPFGITAGPDNALWFVESAGNKVGRISTSGAITEFPIPTAGSRPTAIAAGPDGNLWFTELQGNKIGRITTAGVITEFSLPIPFSSPAGITRGPDNALWFAEILGNRIGRITTSGAISEFTIPTPGSQPSYITTGPDGALWFSESAANKIGRVTTSGAFTEFPLPPTSPGRPQGITTGPDGAVWFTEFDANRIGRITTAGDITEYQVTPGDPHPIEITSGPDGALWFTESAKSKIGRITTAGVITDFTVPTADSGPTGITLGPDGALWFTELTGNNIGRIVPPGTCTVAFTPTDTPVGQPARNLAVTPLICQTNPNTGACVNPPSPGASSTVQVSQGETVFFSTFVQGQGTFVPYDPANNRIFIIAQQGATPVGESSAAIKMTGAPTVSSPPSDIVAAVAPNARTASPGTTVTAFATIINGSQTQANACSIALPSGVPATFLYQTTNPSTNVPVGTPNQPVDIPAGGSQSFYFAITPTASFNQDIPLVFACTNKSPAPVFPGLNTFLLSSSPTPIADMLSISDTQTHDGNMVIPSPTGTGLIVTASINLRTCQ